MNRNSHEFAALLDFHPTPETRPALTAHLVAQFGEAARGSIAAFLDLIIAADLSALDRVNAQDAEMPHLLALTSLVHARTAKLPTQDISAIGKNFDFLAAQKNNPDWSLPRCMNFFYRAQLAPTKQSAIVTSIRNEGINLVEWLAHHRLLGFDNFIIYANDNDDGSSELLELLAVHGVITLIWNDTALKGEQFPSNFQIQAKAFAHALEFLPQTRDYEWLMFADLDEFLITRNMLDNPHAPRPIDELFAKLSATRPAASAIALHWKWITSFAQYRRLPGLNFARFIETTGHDHVKTIVKTRRCLDFLTSHRPELPRGDIIVDSSFQPIGHPHFKFPPVYDYAHINHYYTKSFEEYVMKHLRCWNNRDFANFFDFGNRRHHPAEIVPAAWQNRLRREIAAITALPGLGERINHIEHNFAETLRQFDKSFGCKALYDRHLHKRRW